MLKRIIEDKQFITHEGLMEHFLYREGKLYAIYYNKRKLDLYEWTE